MVVYLPTNTAQESKKCSPPPVYPHARLSTKYSTKLSFNDRDKVYYDCADSFSEYRGTRGIQCVQGEWTKLLLKCESK